jgi:hypothetical protein
MSRKIDIRLWSLIIPAVASAVGFFCFSVLAYSFTELTTLPAAFRTALVLVGAFALAFGSEVGTLASVVEIYRKGERVCRWDSAALVVSVATTGAAFVLAFAELLGARATWGATVRLYGPIVLGLLAALDSYGGFMELGLYSHNKPAEAAASLQRRREEWKQQIEDRLWRAEQEAVYNARFQEINGASAQNDLAAQLRAANAEIDRLAAQWLHDSARQPEPPAAALAAEPSAPRRKAQKIDWIAIRAVLNGDGENMDVDTAARLLQERGFELPNRSTLWRWVNDTRKIEVN